MGAQKRAERALVIDVDPERLKALTEVLEGMRVRVTPAANAETGWKKFANSNAEVVIAALKGDDVEKGAEWFLRRLQSEFMGTMPLVYFICKAGEIEADSPLAPDGYLIPPVSTKTVAALVGADRVVGDSHARQATRLRELYDISLLGNNVLKHLDTLVARTALTFQAANCIITGPTMDSPLWPRSSVAIAKDARAATLSKCAVALNAGVTVFISDSAPDGTAAPGQSFLAAPLGGTTSTAIGALVLVDDPRRFSADEADALQVLARRTAAELAWMTAHERLVGEHENLRETSLVDAMLGVWTRAALEQSVATQMSTSSRHDEPLALAVMDIVQLRRVNDRHGHKIGDAVLRYFAHTVRERIREQDQVGRFGGDELAVLLVGSDKVAAKTAMQELVAYLRDNPYRDEQTELEIPLEVTVGLTDIGTEESHPEHAFARALRAVRTARRTQEVIYMLSVSDLRPGDSISAIDFPNAEALPAGSTLGGMYRILHEISRGSMGVVYRAEDLGLGRPVAIKVLRSDLASNKALVARFRAEAAMLASVHHRNLVQVHSFGAEGEEVFFVMELVEGEPLSDVIVRLAERRKRIGRRAVKKIIAEIADALEAVHAVGIIHRDVKPSNVLLDRINDRAVLVDVGVAKRKEDAGDAAGTPGFAGPEAFLDANETPATDVYGLAATTYTVLTGRSPFGTGELATVVNRQLFEPPIPPSEIDSGISLAVDEVLLRALAPEQEKRYSSASAFAVAISRALEQQTRTGRLRRESIQFPVQQPPAASPAAASPAAASPAAASANPPAAMGSGIPTPVGRQSVALNQRPDVGAGSQPNATPPALGSGSQPTVEPPAEPPAVGPPTILIPDQADPHSLVTRAGRQPPSTHTLNPLSIQYNDKSDIGMTRGVVFRVASKLLVHRLGTSWLQSAVARDRELAAILDPQLAPMSWHAVELLIELLDSAKEAADDPHSLARTLGRAITSATFTRFFGADPKTETPGGLLEASQGFWGRYHTWGEASVVSNKPQIALVQVKSCPGNLLLCSLLEGSFGRIAELAEATGVATAHPECRGAGAKECRFAIRWDVKSAST